MPINLSDHDKEIIRLVDAQVRKLSSKSASDNAIIATLIDFIPDVRCIVTGTCEKQLDLYCREYQYFYYFLRLLHQLDDAR